MSENKKESELKNMELEILNSPEVTPSAKGIIFAFKWSVKKNECDFLKQIFLGILSGVLIGLGFIACFAATEKIETDGLKILVSSCLFAGAIVLITYIGGGLYTSHLVATIPAFKKCIKFKTLFKGMFGVLIGNILGTGLVAFIGEFAGVWVNSSGQLTPIATSAMEAVRGKLFLLSEEILSNSVKTKTLLITILFVFGSGILCNMLVSTTLPGTGAASSDFGKIVVMFFLIVYFVAAGFQHGPANSFIFWICLIQAFNKVSVVFPDNLSYQMTYLYSIYFLIVNIFFALIGNWVGGGIIMPGILYFVNKNTTEEYLKLFRETKINK